MNHQNSMMFSKRKMVNYLYPTKCRKKIDLTPTIKSIQFSTKTTSIILEQ